MIIKDAVNKEKNICTVIKYKLQTEYQDSRETKLDFLIRDYSYFVEKYSPLFFVNNPVGTVREYLTRIDNESFKELKEYIDHFGLISSIVDFDYDVKSDEIKIKFTVEKKTEAQLRTDMNYIHAVAGIVNSKYITNSRFQNQKDFASVIGTSKASISKYVGIDRFINKYKNEKYVFDLKINTLYNLSKLNPQKLKEFVDACGGYLKISKIPDKQFEKIFYEYKKRTE